MKDLLLQSFIVLVHSLQLCVGGGEESECSRDQGTWNRLLCISLELGHQRNNVVSVVMSKAEAWCLLSREKQWASLSCVTLHADVGGWNGQLYWSERSVRGEAVLVYQHRLLSAEGSNFLTGKLWKKLLACPVLRTRQWVGMTCDVAGRRKVLEPSYRIKEVSE